MSVFPEKLNTVLDYVTNVSLSTTNSAPTFGTETSFRLNSLFDPEFAVGGHQPYGYDQITPFYSRYMVHAVDVEFTFSDPSSDGLYASVYFKNFYDTSTLQGSSISAASERPTNWVRPINNTGSQVVVFRKHVDLATMMGLSKSQFEGGWFALSGLAGTDPAQTPYVSMAVADSRSGTTQTVIVSAKFRFHCQFWGRRMPAQS